MNNRQLSIIIAPLLCTIFSLSGMLTSTQIFKNIAVPPRYTFTPLGIPKCNTDARYQSSNNHQYYTRNYCVMPTKDFYSICKALEKPVKQTELLSLLQKTKSNAGDLEKLYAYNNKELELCNDVLSQCKNFMGIFKKACALTLINMPIYILSDSFGSVGQFEPVAWVILIPATFGAIVGGGAIFFSIPFFPIVLINQLESKKKLPLIQENNDLLRTLMIRLQENKLLTLKEAATDYEIML